MLGTLLEQGRIEWGCTQKVEGLSIVFDFVPTPKKCDFSVVQNPRNLFQDGEYLMCFLEGSAEWPKAFLPNPLFFLHMEGGSSCADKIGAGFVPQHNDTTF